MRAFSDSGRTVAFVLALGAAEAGAANPPIASARPALEDGDLGLFPAQEFRLAQGRCSDCPAPKQALWYFENDLVGTPKPGVPVADFTKALPPAADVEAWARTHVEGVLPPRPSVVWVGSPELVPEARLSQDGKALELPGGHRADLTLVPRLATNRAWYDQSTTAFLQGKALRVRGATRQHPDGTSSFEARVIWPLDWSLDTERPQESLAGTSLSELVAAEEGGARSPAVVRVIWERPGPRRWSGRAVLAFVLSGAQGDDDEAHGGHFAVATGRVGSHGEWADWTVNNFYGLDSVSEKGIIGAQVPLDNYLMDLNSGQSYYRPVHVLAVILSRDRAAALFQGAVARVYNRYYRHDLVYHHAKANCTGISMDTLRLVGWRVPRLGSGGRVKAVGAFFYVSLSERSVAAGERTFDYLSEEQSRLLPRPAFEVTGQDLLALLAGTTVRTPTRYEEWLKADAEAVLFLRLPQIPTSRAWGREAIGRLEEYRARLPKDRSSWKLHSTASRPFPEELRDGAPPPPVRSKAVPVAATTLVLACGAPIALFRFVRRRLG